MTETHENLVDKIRESIKNGGRILVVGGRTTNFGDDLRSDPRLVFWDTTDPDSFRKEVPSNVRAMVFTAWLGHSLFGRLVLEARKRGIPYTSFSQGTGQIKRILNFNEPSVNIEVSPVEPPTEEPTTPVETSTPPPEEPSVAKKAPAKGQLRDFVRQEADLYKTPYAEEARRVHELAKKAGFDTTVGSITQSIYALRREMAKRAQNRAGKGFLTQEETKPKVAPPAPPTPPAPVPPSEPLPPVVQQVLADRAEVATLVLDDNSTVSEAYRLLDEAIAAMSLVREALKKVELENQKMKERDEKVRKMFLGE